MSGRSNGRSQAGPLRMPIRTAVIKLKDDYKGFELTMQSNPPMRIFTEIQTQPDFNRMQEIIKGLIISWNFVDTEGEPIASGDLQSISIDMVGRIIGAYLDHITQASAVPKA